MKIEQLRLKNNLDVLFIDAPGSTASTAQIWFRAGSALENSQNAGVAHFLEHMFFKGTKARPGFAIANEVESFGGEVNAFTSFDYTCYYINSPHTHLLQTLDILMDMVSDPEFKEDELFLERGVVTEEFRRSLDNPFQFSFKELQKSCFTGAYEHPILGSEETIKNFSREQVIQFRENFYNTTNALLIVGGDLRNKNKLIETIEKFNIPSGPKTEFEEFKLKANATLNVHHKEVRQALLNLAINSAHCDQIEGVYEDLAINCLGHGETSRLYRKLIVESSLATSLSASTMFFVKGGAHFLRVAAPLEHLPKIYEMIIDIIKTALDEGLTEEELIKIKNQYVAAKVYDKESVESFSFSMGQSFAQTGDIYFEDKFMENIKRATLRDVNRALHSIFQRAIHIGLQIPKTAQLEKEKVKIHKFQNKLSDLKKKEVKKSKKELRPKTSKFDTQVKVFELKKGLKLIHRHNLLTPTFVLHAYIKGGLSKESQTINGHHHLLSNLLTKGYKKTPYNVIKNDLENKSAMLSSFAGKNAYGLTLHGQSEHMADLMRHFFGSLLQPELPMKFIAHEKKMIFRSFDNLKEDPLKQCFQKFNQLVFNGHPYAQNLMGTPQVIKKASRSELLKLHQRNLKKEEIVLTYCGDLEVEEVIAIIHPYIETLASRNSTPSKLHKFHPLMGKEIHLAFDREQVQIVMGLPSYRLGAKEDLYLKMLSGHLSGQSSELFVEVRDKQGLCYTIQPIHLTGLEAGYWGIYVASGQDKAHRAIQSIKKIINNLRENGLTDDQFERVKRMIEGQNLINLQTNEDYASIYSVPELHGLGVDYHYNSNKKIQSFTKEEFNQFLKSFLGRKWNLVSAGPEILPD